MNDTQFKNRIMRRVYAVYVLQKVINHMAFKIYASLVLLYGIKVFIHVEAVVNNMPKISDVAGLYNFIMYSVLNTGVSVQLIVFGVIGFVVWMIRDFIKDTIKGVKHSSMQYTH